MPLLFRTLVILLLLLLPGAAGAQSSPSRTLTLRAGWNAVALGAEQIASLNAPGVAAVATWSAASGYAVEAPTEATFNAGPGGRRGFWIFASAPATMTYEPRQDNQGSRLSLAAGWNLVAFPGLTGSLVLPEGASPQLYELALDGSQTAVGANQARGDRPYWLFTTAPGTVTWSTQPAVAFPAGSTLSVSPANSTVNLSGFREFTAVVRLPDGSSRDVTGEAAWTTTDGSLAAFTAPGLVKGLNPGLVGLNASLAGLTATAQLTVTDLASPGTPTPVPLPSPPLTRSIAVGGVGSNAVDMTVGDYDGDGRDDVAVACGTDNCVTIFWNRLTTTGDFTTSQIALAQAPNSIASGRMNADAFLDLVISQGPFGTAETRSFLNDGAGGFTAAPTAATFRFLRLLTGDSTGDSNTDIIGGLLQTATTGLLARVTGSGTGGFGAGIGLSGNSPLSGRPAVAVGPLGFSNNFDAAYGSTNVAFVVASSTISLASSISRAVPAVQVGLAIANVTNVGASSGLADIVGVSAAGDLLVMARTGPGTFDPNVIVPLGAGISTPADLAVAEMISDSSLDVATCNRGSHNVAILPGNGNGTFQAPVLLRTGTTAAPTPTVIQAANLNGDTRSDLVVLNSGENSVSFLIR